MITLRRRSLGVVLVSTLAGSCAHAPMRESARSSAVAPTTRVTAEPTAAATQPGTSSAAGTVLLRIRRLQNTNPTTRPLADKAPTVPADAKLLDVIEVLVPVGPNYVATTKLGTTTLRLTGRVQRLPDEKYRAKIDYSEETPFDPKLSWGARHFNTLYEFTPGEEAILFGAVAEKGERVYAFSVIAKR